MTKLRRVTFQGFTIGQRLGTKLALQRDIPHYVVLLHSLKNLANNENLERECHVFFVDNTAYAGDEE